MKRQEGKKWMVEHYRGDNNIVLDTVQLNNSVYIFKCENSAITVKGKCNNVILDSCKKVGVIFDREAFKTERFYQSLLQAVKSKIKIVFNFSIFFGNILDFFAFFWIL